MKLSTTSGVWTPVKMLGMLLTSWRRMLVFLRLMVKPYALQACATQLMRCCRASSVCAVRAPSSANSISLTSTFRTLVFARRRARLKSFPSILVERYTPSSDWLKAQDSSRKKKIPKSVGASTQPCLTPLLIGKAADTCQAIKLNKSSYFVTNFHFCDKHEATRLDLILLIFCEEACLSVGYQCKKVCLVLTVRRVVL